MVIKNVASWNDLDLGVKIGDSRLLYTSHTEIRCKGCKESYLDSKLKKVTKCKTC